MASITIRDLDEETKARLRIQAAHHQRSMEEEARSILRSGLLKGSTPPLDLGESVRRRFASLGGIELHLPAREPMREPPEPNR